jgi:hypothetical protein
MGITQVRHFGQVPGFGAGRPPFHTRQRAVACAGDALLPRELLEAVVAQVVRTALEQRYTRRHADGCGHHGQILVEELVLQRARAGGDEHPPAREQRRHQVGKGFARTRARLHHQRRAVLQGERHPSRHGEL